MRVYPHYRDSGVEWLGEVPHHWRVKPLKFVASTNDEALSDAEDPLRTMFYVDISAVDPTRGITRCEELAFEDAPSRARRLVRDGDTIVSTVRTYLRAIAPIDSPKPEMVVSTGFAVIRPRAIDAEFASWVLREQGFLDEIVARSVGVSYPAINAPEIGNLPIAIPPHDEQRAIAAFLNRETERIDSLIAKKRLLIERLQEFRTALITRTVTRGLPPEAARAAGLDPSPRLKPSGVEWLGDVPEHWAIGRFSREVDIAEGQVNPEVEPFASMLLIAPNHIESGTGQLMETHTSAEQGAISGKYLCRHGEVIYSKIRPALAKVTLAPTDCLCSADMYPMRTRRSLMNEYLYWLLLSKGFTIWSVLEADRVAMPKINRETLSTLRLPLPPISEQRALTDYLRLEIARLGRLQSRIGTAIERLDEMRAALVTSAVTGKIDVRNTATTAAGSSESQS